MNLIFAPSGWFANCATRSARKPIRSRRVANISYYAGPYPLIPAARWDDRRLDLLLFRGTGRRATLAFALDLLRSTHLKRPDVSVLRVREEVLLRGPAGALAQIDGDICPEPLPLAARLAPEPLLVLAPSPGPSTTKSN